jgi:hypothetical protein
MIAGAFDEHGIVIAFPQRDLRLQAIGPIPVEVIPVARVRDEADNNSDHTEAGQHVTKDDEHLENNNDAGQVERTKRNSVASSGALRSTE